MSGKAYTRWNASIAFLDDAKSFIGSSLDHFWSELSNCANNQAWPINHNNTLCQKNTSGPVYISWSRHVFALLYLRNSGSTLKRNFAPSLSIVLKFLKVFVYIVKVYINKFIILGEIYCFKLPKCLKWEQHIIIRDKDIRTKISMIWNFPCGDRNKIKKLLLWPYWHKGLWSYVLEMVCFIVHSVFLDISL